MIYLDTSSLAKAYLQEIGSEQVRGLLEASDDSLAISTLSLVEFRCALGRRQRANMLSDSDARKIWSSFNIDLDSDVFDVLPVANEDHIAARHLIDQVAPLALKALDAIHLAVLTRQHSNDNSIRFATSDFQQAAAARSLKIETIGIAIAN